MPATASPLTSADLSALSCQMAPAVSLRASAKDGEALPRRIKFLNWGENKGRTTGARVIVNERTLAALTANQEAFACDTVELDYEHQSVKKHPNYKEDPRHSAAHGTVEVIEGEGVFLNVQEYTPNGMEHAANYKDVSGVARTDPKTGELLLVSSVALTHRGDVSGMEFSDHVIALNATDPELSNTSPSQETNPNNKPQSTMDETKDKYRELLISLLGIQLGEGETEITDEAIVGAAENFQKEKALSAKAPSVDPDKPDEKDPIIALTARFDALEQKQEAADKSALVSRATAQGKVIPLSAEEIEETSLVTLSAIVARLPEGEVPTTTQVDKEKPTEEVALSADEAAVAKQLNLTPEQYRSAKK